MTLFIIHTLFLLALLVTAVLAYSRIKNAQRDYLPMLLFLISTFLFETLQFIFASDRPTLKVLIHLQIVIGFLLICWQAQKWKIFNNLKGYKLLIAIMLGVWLVELIFQKQEENNIPWFSVVYSFTIVLVAIELLKRQLTIVNQRLFQNSIVLFSIGLIFYYTFVVLMDLFMLIGQYSGQEVLRVGYIITIALGLVTNFLYLRAVLCLPKLTN